MCVFTLKTNAGQGGKSRGDVRYSTGSVGSNIVVTMCGVGWVLDLRGHHFVNYINI